MPSEPMKLRASQVCKTLLRVLLVNMTSGLTLDLLSCIAHLQNYTLREKCLVLVTLLSYREIIITVKNPNVSNICNISFLSD